MSEMHKRWEFKPFFLCSRGETGGHVRTCGIFYGWTSQKNSWWSREFTMWGLFGIEWREDGVRWAVASIAPSLNFKNARWRFGDREKARNNRRTRKRFALERASR